MKIEIYFDVYPWTKSASDIFPTMLPGAKMQDATRYKLTTEIPDPANPDVELKGRAEKVEA